MISKGIQNDEGWVVKQEGNIYLCQVYVKIGLLWWCILLLLLLFLNNTQCMCVCVRACVFIVLSSAAVRHLYIFFRCAIDYASFLFSWEERQHAVDGDFESGLGAV